MIIKHYTKSIRHSILLPQHLIEKMSEVAKAHFPYEFGGILTGYKGEDQDVVIDFEIPTKYVQTKTSFTRHPESLNKYLKNVYANSNGRIEYIGEWHTHPSGSANYSSKDFESIQEISQDENSKTASPVLLIFSVNKKECDYNIYKYVDESLVFFNKKEKI